MRIYIHLQLRAEQGNTILMIIIVTSLNDISDVQGPCSVCEIVTITETS